jgi:cholesterol transport system auxiliary component
LRFVRADPCRQPSHVPVASDAYALLLKRRSLQADHGSASARIELAARVVHNRDNRVVASRVFSQRVNATSTDVAAVAQAFERGLAQLAPEVVGWTLREGGRR